MTADSAASNSAVIAGRSHTSTRPVSSSCRASSASNPGHSGPVGYLRSRWRHRSRRPALLPRPMPTPRATPVRHPTPRRHHHLPAAPPERHHNLAAARPRASHARHRPSQAPPFTVPTTIPEPAATGAIAVRVVQRETTREPSSAECVTRVLASPRACREVLNGLTTLADTRRRRRAGTSCWHRQPCDRPMAH